MNGLSEDSQEWGAETWHTRTRGDTDEGTKILTGGSVDGTKVQ